MSDQNWVVPTDALEFFSQQNRRIGQEERRPSVRKASDLLGPGIAPYAVPLTDFNSDMAAFNGLFIAEPSTPYANNGPDNTKWWVGQTVADQFNGGWQMFSTFQPADLVGGRHTIMVRSFSLAPDSNARFYSDWQILGGDSDTGWIMPTLNAGWTTTSTKGLYKVKAGILYLNLVVAKTSWSANDVIFTITNPAHRPQDNAYFLGQVAGALRFFYVHTDGRVISHVAGTTGILSSVNVPL